jgi:hypothetical protein
LLGQAFNEQIAFDGSKPLHFVGVSGRTVIMFKTALPVRIVGSPNVKEKHRITFSDITIRCDEDNTKLSSVPGGVGAITMKYNAVGVGGGALVSFKNCDISSTMRHADGVLVTGQGTEVILENTRVHHCGQTGVSTLDGRSATTAVKASWL